MILPENWYRDAFGLQQAISCKDGQFITVDTFKSVHILRGPISVMDVLRGAAISSCRRKFDVNIHLTVELVSSTRRSRSESLEIVAVTDPPHRIIRVEEIAIEVKGPDGSLDPSAVQNVLRSAMIKWQYRPQAQPFASGDDPYPVVKRSGVELVGVNSQGDLAFT